ncbi:hypothetical protein EVJ58_g1445 [Rhodofomes roseus]|uniref:SnoaL-like polyketide cyclase n=1 Tax=Rhodofomes roseus TaxID=34475 RepID=A0A4Y9Z108_9APHY|nr:hypothetical protein EVJ58_g1445 [Rhodofomes roseus]
MSDLSAQQVKQRFGVSIPIKAMPVQLSEQEERNVSTVLKYMRTAYSYELNSGKDSVLEFCAPNNTFSAPSTFPTAHTVDEYAGSHAKVLQSLNDLHIIQFDVVIAKEDFVSLRYTAEGTHTGEPHGGIQPNGQHAQWTAQGSFIMEGGKIKHWWKGECMRVVGSAMS